MKYFTRIGDTERHYSFERRGNFLIAHCGEQSYEIDLCMVGDGTAFSMIVDGRLADVIVERAKANVVVQLFGHRIEVEVEDERQRAASAVAGARTSGKQEILAPMPGSVVELLVSVGDKVDEGQTLLVLEAMKMQNPIQSEVAGVVTKVCVSKGTAVAGDAVLIELDSEG